MLELNSLSFLKMVCPVITDVVLNRRQDLQTRQNLGALRYRRMGR